MPELIGSFADVVAREAAMLYGEQASPPDRARVHRLVYIAGFAELVAAPEPPPVTGRGRRSP